jgi:hypothetical protein
MSSLSHCKKIDFLKILEHKLHFLGHINANPSILEVKIVNQAQGPPTLVQITTMKMNGRKTFLIWSHFLKVGMCRSIISK